MVNAANTGRQNSNYLNVKITEAIERLAEINAAGVMIDLGKDLRDERQTIVSFLKVENKIELVENGGFRFVGEDSEKNKAVYMYSYQNF